MSTREEGIKQLRDLADALDREEPVSIIIAWVNTATEVVNIGSMEFGNPFFSDALALHLLRARCQDGRINDGIFEQRIVQ